MTAPQDPYDPYEQQYRQQRPYPQQPYEQQGPPPGYYQPQPGYQPGPGRGHAAAAAPRRRRRVFLWVFLAIQALFIIWLVTGLAGTNTAAPHAQVASACFHHGWFPLFKSQADCVTHVSRALTQAGDVGKGIGAALIVVVWVVVDFFLGLGYLIYRLSTRTR